MEHEEHIPGPHRLTLLRQPVEVDPPFTAFWLTNMSRAFWYRVTCPDGVARSLVGPRPVSGMVPGAEVDAEELILFRYEDAPSWCVLGALNLVKPLNVKNERRL